MSIRNHEFKLVSPIPFHLHRALLAFHHSISWIPFLQVRMLFPKNISIFTFLFSPEMQKKLFQYCYTHNIMKVNHLKRIKDLFTAFFFRWKGYRQSIVLRVTSIVLFHFHLLWLRYLFHIHLCSFVSVCTWFIVSFTILVDLILCFEFVDN